MDFNIVSEIVSSQLTALGVIFIYSAVIIGYFLKGKIFTVYQVNTIVKVQNLVVDQANLRANEYKEAWQIAEARVDVLIDYLKQLGVVVPKVVEKAVEGLIKGNDNDL